MNLDKVYICDIEAKGLLNEVESQSDLHVLSVGYKNSVGEWDIKSTKDRNDILKIFENPENTVVGHFFIPYDAPALEKMLGFKVKAKIIDSLAISWYLYNTKNKHGLEEWGVELGHEKVFIDPSEWKTLSYEKAVERCSTDVKINIKLWVSLLSYLRELYDNNDKEVIRIINYLNFIMKCYKEQERQKIKVDINKVNSNLTYFEKLKESKVEVLKEVMPKVPKYSVKSKPAKPFKKDGTLSSLGVKWYEMLSLMGLPEDYDGEVKKLVAYENPNPNSVKQKKEWLYRLGWKPQTFVYNRDKKTGDVEKVEQILTPEKTLCPSVLKLAEKEPAIKSLEGISILTHRIGLLKGLLKNCDENGYIVQGLYQLANSLRWQHFGVVNFPRVTGRGDISDGKWIRECLIAGEGYKFVQSDLSGIESRTSDHYTYDLNPDLIEETSKPYFDPHTKIAVQSNLMTKDEEIWFKWKKENAERKEKGIDEELHPETFGEYTEDFENIRNLDEKESNNLMNKLKAARSKGKTTNYASLYLVGAQTLSRNLEISKKEAQRLIDAYWEIHWAVKKVAESFEIKTVQNQMWILCPISRFWHPIRNEKDAFSVVNQSSAVYCFNIWLLNITRQGVWPILQTHDDLLLRCKDGEENKYADIINKAMDMTNKQLKLNTDLACEVQIGDNFSETH